MRDLRCSRLRFNNHPLGRLMKQPVQAMARDFGAGPEFVKGARDGLAQAKPFLKWVGGKRQLLPELLKHIPEGPFNYFEPFVGGGALFFALSPDQAKTAVLGDSNLHLIAAYKGVRDDVEAVIGALKIHQARHSLEHYLEARRHLVVDGRPAGTIPAVAARVIYINRTCFNGLWRVNKKGGYNVPMGRYENPTICDGPNLKACSRALQGVLLRHLDFWWTIETATKGDFVYFDPPYVPASTSANFTGYAKEGFTYDDQVRLRDCALRLKAAGANVLLSNSDTSIVRDLYKRGFQMRLVEARRAVNSDASKRGKVGELLIW